MSHMLRAVYVLAFVAALGLAGPGATEPVIDANDIGPDLPTAGRSLFDQLVYEQGVGGKTELRLPYPFSALLDQLRDQINNQQDPLIAVLIPLGRSLQRQAAAPDFFARPRVVVAVVGEAASASLPKVKDRLYIGYQEQAGVLEVISYNDAMGRFEFQIVKNYRAETQPQLYYAKRIICMACHTNQAPIFSRPLWNETNANPEVAARLAAQQDTFYGIPVQRGIDIPAALDAATDRANKLSLYQRLWQEGCAIAAEVDPTACRAALLTAALQLRLSNWQGYLESDTLKAVQQAWQQHWPEGLWLPNADIPNRDPLTEAAIFEQRAVVVPAVFDPLAPRAHQQRIDFTEPAAMLSVIQGLAEFFKQVEVENLDKALASASAHAAVAEYAADCRVRVPWRSEPHGRLDFDCVGANELKIQGRLYFEAGRFVRGQLDRLRIGADNFNAITVHLPMQRRLDKQPTALPLQLEYTGGQIRRRSGNALPNMTLRLTAEAVDNARVATALLYEHLDYSLLAQAIGQQEDVQSLQPDDMYAMQTFQADKLLAALYARMQIANVDASQTESDWPAARLEPYTALQVTSQRKLEPAFAAVLASLQRYCAACHASAEDFPPNFLSGEPQQIKMKLMQCAARIEHRLSMWLLAPAQRDKSPMPPASVVPDPARLTQSRDWQRMLEYISGLRSKQHGSPTDKHNYEAHAACLLEGG